MPDARLLSRGCLRNAACAAPARCLRNLCIHDNHCVTTRKREGKGKGERQTSLMSEVLECRVRNASLYFASVTDATCPPRRDQYIHFNLTFQILHERSSRGDDPPDPRGRSSDFGGIGWWETAGEPQSRMSRQRGIGQRVEDAIGDG